MQETEYARAAVLRGFEADLATARSRLAEEGSSPQLNARYEAMIVACEAAIEALRNA